MLGREAPAKLVVVHADRKPHAGDVLHCQHDGQALAPQPPQDRGVAEPGGDHEQRVDVPAEQLVDDPLQPL